MDWTLAVVLVAVFLIFGGIVIVILSMNKS